MNKYNLQKMLTPKSSLPLLLAFILPLFSWVYLALICEMVIIHDSLEYERLGSVLASHPILEYFKNGPNRELLYPLTISLAMRVADFFSTSYLAVQKTIQIFIVILAQFLTLAILRRLKINPLLTAVTILYLGFSPVIVNSIFNIYSEVIAYPLVLGIILTSLKCENIINQISHNSTQDLHWKSLGLWAILLSTLFILITFVKASFEVITPIFLLMYIIKLIHALIQKKMKLAISLFIFTTLCLGLYSGAVAGYKFMNKIYNGQFILTSRGASILYGNTMRRAAPLTVQRLLTNLSYLPDPDGHFCRKYFSQEQCIYESYKNSDIIAFKKSVELQAKGFSISQINQIFLKLSFAEITAHPFQYLLLTFLEIFRAFSWESTTPKFVVYPEWISTVLNWTWLNRGLNCVLTLLTLASLIYAVIFVRKKTSMSSERIIMYNILWLIGAYLLAHAPFLVILRHILPIVPLYLILIGFFLQQIIFQENSSLRSY